MAVRGAGITFFSSGASQIVQIGASLLLARLLLPADFGLIAMVTTFSLLLSNCGLNGITEALIQTEDIRDSLASNLFWINIAIGILLTALMAAVGPVLAFFFGDARIVPVAAALSLTILFTVASTAHLALLKRALHFSAVSTNEVLARLLSVAVSLLLAYFGAGYWALVTGAVAQSAAVAAGAWIRCRWIPSRPSVVAGTGAAVRFALQTYGHFCVCYLSHNIDNLLIGWRFGAQPLGLYKKAYDLFSLAASQTAPLTTVAVSALSRIHGDLPEYRRSVLRALSLLAFVGMGISGLMTLAGRDVVRLLLGQRWEAAGRIFVFFAPGIGAMLLIGVTGWIQLSAGRADRRLRSGFLEAGVTSLFIVLGMPWGPAGVAVGWTLSCWILLVPMFAYAGRPIGLGIGEVIATLWKYIAAAILAGCGAAIVLAPLSAHFGGTSALGAAVNLAVATGLYGIFYVGIVVLLFRGIAPLRHLGMLWSRMISSASVPSSGQPANIH